MQFADRQIVAAWDAVSEAYQQRYEIPVESVHLGPMVPDAAELGLDLPISGSNVLDYGCGAGQNAIACALSGAQRTVGVDPSERQLAAAKALAVDAGVDVDWFLLGDESWEHLQQKFNLILAIYSMQFVADLPNTLRRLAQRSDQGCILVISADHPVRNAGEWHGADFLIDSYFARGWQSWRYDFPEALVKTEMKRYRRTLQDWFHALTTSGFEIRSLLEPGPPEVDDLFGQRSKYGSSDPRNVFNRERLERVPGSLVLVAEYRP